MNAAGAALLGVAPGAVTLAAQVTCLLLLALVLAWLGRRGSPRTLHLLWTTTFVLVLALPPSAPSVPRGGALLPAAVESPRQRLARPSANCYEDIGSPPPRTATNARLCCLGTGPSGRAFRWGGWCSGRSFDGTRHR